MECAQVDVEGSEFAFLEDAVDSGVIGSVQQLVLEWHHYPFDMRYGFGSAPSLNALATTFAAHGLLCWWVHDGLGGWPGTHVSYHRFGFHDVRYNLASFRRVPSHRRRQHAGRGRKGGGFPEDEDDDESSQVIEKRRRKEEKKAMKQLKAAKKTGS